MTGRCQLEEPYRRGSYPIATAPEGPPAGLIDGEIDSGRRLPESQGSKAMVGSIGQHAPKPNSGSLPTTYDACLACISHADATADRNSSDAPGVWAVSGAGGCLLAIAALVLMAWAEVTFTPPDQCAAETCGDISLLPVFIGPWLAIGAIVLLVAGLLTLRVRRRMLGGGAVEGSETALLASPGLRIVAGLLDLGVIILIGGIVFTPLAPLTSRLSGSPVGGTVVNIVGCFLLFTLSVGYVTYFWSQRGQSIGMMPFGFKVRLLATDQYPPFDKL